MRKGRLILLVIATLMILPHDLMATENNLLIIHEGKEPMRVYRVSFPEGLLQDSFSVSGQNGSIALKFKYDGMTLTAPLIISPINAHRIWPRAGGEIYDRKFIHIRVLVDKSEEGDVTTEKYTTILVLIKLSMPSGYCMTKDIRDRIMIAGTATDSLIVDFGRISWSGRRQFKDLKELTTYYQPVTLEILSVFGKPLERCTN